jgi:hypothetical protein
MLVHIWRLKGALSPRWTIKAWTLVKWGLSLLPLGALGTAAFNLWSKGDATAWIVTVESLVSPASVTTLVAILLLLLYLYWASSDARVRLDLIKICTPSRKSDRGLAITAADLDPDDVLRRSSDPSPAFLSRRVRPFKVGVDEDRVDLDGVKAISDVWAIKRAVVVLGPAGMGKTRLVCEAIKRQSPTTVVVAPSYNALASITSEQLLYLKGRHVAIILDDLDYYTKVDPAEFIRRVAVSAKTCVVAATCTVSSLATVNSDAVPQLRNYFNSLEQYELLPLSAAQIEILKRDHHPKSPTLDYAGNPGMLLFDMDRIRGAYNALTIEQRDVLESVALMFWANVRPIERGLLLIIVNRVFQRTMDMSALRVVLDALSKIPFLKACDPIEPVEAYLDGVVNHPAAILRNTKILEEMFFERRDASALFQLAVGYHFRKELNAELKVTPLVVDLYLASGKLADAAVALNNCGLTQIEAERPYEEIETTFRKAAAVGREAATSEGLVETARSLTNIGDAQRLRNRPLAESEASYREAVAVGRQAGTPEALAETQRALFNLAVALGSSDRPLQEVATTYREAAEIGRQLATPQSLTMTTSSLLNLAGTLSQRGQPVSIVAEAYKEAAGAGRMAATPSSMMDAGKALFNLAQVLRLTSESAADMGNRISGVAERLEIINAFLMAAEIMQQVNWPPAQAEAARALIGLGIALREARRPPEEVEHVFRRASEAGRRSGTQEGLILAADALFRLSLSVMFSGASRSSVQRACLEAADAGAQAGTPGALENAARALSNLAKYLSERQQGLVRYLLRYSNPRSLVARIVLVIIALLVELVAYILRRLRLPKVRKICLETAAVGRRAGTPTGLEIAARALLTLGNQVDSAGGSIKEVEKTYEDAAEAGRQAATPEGWETTAMAMANLVGVLRRRGGRTQVEIARLTEAAADAGRRSGTPAGLSIVDQIKFW